MFASVEADKSHHLGDLGNRLGWEIILYRSVATGKARGIPIHLVMVAEMVFCPAVGSYLSPVILMARGSIDNAVSTQKATQSDDGKVEKSPELTVERVSVFVHKKRIVDYSGSE